MNKEKMAEMLNGREYGNEITKEEEALAKKSGLLIIFGYSDDNMECRGIATDEIGCYNGGKFLFDSEGFLADFDDIDFENESETRKYLKRKDLAKEIKAIWGDYGYSWLYETEVPHATFEIVEDGEPYCRGIVIDGKDIK